MTRRRRGVLSARDVRKLAAESPFRQTIPARETQPAPRPGQPVEQIDGGNQNLSGHKWVILSPEPATRKAQLEAELERQLEKQRSQWVVKDGRFVQGVVTRRQLELAAEVAARKLIAKLSPEEKRAVAKRLAERREADELSKSIEDPTTRVQGLLASTGGDGEVTRLGRNTEKRSARLLAVDADTGAPLGRSDADVEKSEERVGFSDVFFGPTFDGVEYR